jgi:two-component system sensor histidine kinase PilS (NtrC family)
MSRRGVMLAFRAVIIMGLVALAVRETTTGAGSAHPTSFGEAILPYLPAFMALVPLVFTLERVPALRPLLGVAWILVFDLVVMGAMIATLGEMTDPELLAFLLLGLVVATARDLLAGSLGGLLAAAGFTYLFVSHDRAVSVFDPVLLSRATVFVAVGLFTGLLSREAEQEREEAAATAAELREQLADLGEHLKNVLASVGSGVMAVDHDGRVRTYNRAAERILGVPSHKVIGRVFLEIEDLAALRPALVERAQVLEDSQQPGGARRPDVVFTRHDGRVARIGYATTPLENIAGGRIGVILVFQDVTLIRDYEARLVRQEQLAALGRLVSGIAHEFGNLLGGARGHVELALAGGPQDAVEALPVVKDTLGRVLVTVENLLRFARGTPLNRVPGVSLPEVLDRALHLLSPELEAQKVLVERAYAADAPTVTADATQLEQVFVNIVINAVHAMNDLELRRLRVAVVRRADAGAEVTIEDCGPGVPHELRGRIFEPFFTTKGPLGGSKVPGTGLGLSMALGVVEAHAGSLYVDTSPLLHGARFFVSLPSTGGETEGDASPRASRAGG